MAPGFHNLPLSHSHLADEKNQGVGESRGSTVGTQQTVPSSASLALICTHSSVPVPHKMGHNLAVTWELRIHVTTILKARRPLPEVAFEHFTEPQYFLALLGL